MMKKVTDIDLRVLKLFKDIPTNVFDKFLCLYDGIKMINRNQERIELVLKDEHKHFDIKPTLDSTHGQPIYFKGKYLNFNLRVYREEFGWALEISGSVHVFFNKWSTGEKHNSNDFYWENFLKAYDEIIRVFRFDPQEVDIVNVEVGVNCTLPNKIPLTFPEIMECILSLFGTSKKKSFITESNRSSSMFRRGERYLKFYGKGIQCGLDERLERIELGYERARQIERDVGAKTLYDLSNFYVHLLFTYQLIKAFKKLHMHHPDLANVPLHEIEADREILEYGKPSFWANLKKKNRYQYRKKRQKHERLTNQYCSYNLTNDLIEMLNKKLD
jgi:hypothetical protein